MKIFILNPLEELFGIIESGEVKKTKGLMNDFFTA